MISKISGFPEDSIILKNLNKEIHYSDSYRVDIENHDDCSVDYLTASVFSADPPKWLKLLANLRDSIVKVFGLKTGLSHIAKKPDRSTRYNTGDKIGFFPVIDRNESEIVMGEDDKHLYFRVSLFAKKNKNSESIAVFITTIVLFHNFWGRVYFLLIKPFHKIIVRNILKRLSQHYDAQRFPKSS